MHRKFIVVLMIHHHELLDLIDRIFIIVLFVNRDSA
jgi:hypothetical protein